MKPAEIRQQTTKELQSSQRTLSREIWQARFNNYTSQLDDTAKIRRLRRQLARVKTILGERARKGGE
jgi:large subunit ribosomal protein L29